MLSSTSGVEQMTLDWSMAVETVDVVVIGAGVAGLNCARKLLRQGATVVVLEARDRVGGRICTLRLPGYEPVELGAQVIHGEFASTWETIPALEQPRAQLAPKPTLLFYVDGGV